MKSLNPGMLQFLRETYPKDTRVCLDQMDDAQAPPIGTEGAVMYGDSLGTIHVKWDNGSTLGVAYGEDRCHKVLPQETEG